MKIRDWTSCATCLIPLAAFMVQTVRVHRQMDQTLKIGQEFSAATTNLANSYFRAGVSSAMNAHAQYLKRELIAGRTPDWTGAPFEQWRREAYAVWFAESPNEALLWREPPFFTNAVLTNSVLTNVTVIYLREAPKPTILKFPE